MSTFSGFSPKALTFFRQLSRNNDREWFNARKAIYETEVRGPMIELVSTISDDLRKFAIDHVPDKPEKAIFRIYRDARFSKDKTPYKTHIAAQFPHRRMPRTAAAAFYFSVSHTAVEIAGGMYMPGPEQLLAFRRALQKRHKQFEKLCGEKSLVKCISKLLGDRMTRVPKDFPQDDPAAEWLKMKNYYFDIELDPKVALTSKIRKEIIDRFKLMTPVIRFINESLLEDLGEEDIPVRPKPMF
jgi:uncharacterized protein (TIGR02453 family)